MPITIFVHENGSTRKADRVDPIWLDKGSSAMFWVDLDDPTADESRILTDVFHFHELAVEDALSEIHHPKVERYDEGYVYAILHGIDLEARKHRFATHDVDFFLGRNYLVTVHGRKTRSIEKVGSLCGRAGHIVGEGPTALMHRIVDQMVDNYLPEVEELEERIEQLEREVFEDPKPTHIQDVLSLKRDIAALRRVVVPQRDIIGRFARREFPEVNEAVAYRFRDVYDHLVRLTEEAFFLQDRTTGLLEANLSTISNRLNAVMKILTVFSTIFMPLTVLSGMYGMNVPLPRFPGSDEVQFWWVSGLMGVVVVAMLWAFRRFKWL